jgi:hypothetical protein
VIPVLSSGLVRRAVVVEAAEFAVEGELSLGEDG